jgi:sulfite exporter TauE/SafE/copper chaperone CopZ
MHCRSCEILLEEKLKSLPNIKSVQVNYKKKQALIYSEKEPDLNIIKLAVVATGYEVGVDGSKNWINQDPKVYQNIIISLMILLAIYFWFRIFNITGLSGVSVSKPSSLLVVLLIGLTAGISTCMALVGGLILGISARYAEKHPEASPIEKFRPHLFFNLGRIVAYFILGGLIGLVGKAFYLSSATVGLLTIFVGILMLVLGVQLTEIFPRLSNSRLTLPSSISKLFGIKKKQEKEYSHSNSILIGALTFFLPCGFTQAMQLYAISTGNFLSGALVMLIFALGTTPGLLSIGGIVSFLSGAFAKDFFRFVGVLVIILAIFNVSNGYNLTGWKNIFLSTGAPKVVSKNDSNVKVENGIQIVHMTQNDSGYQPNKFTIQKGLPVKLIITSTNSNTCAASISIPKQKISKFLGLGENIIEFTPKETGEIKFTCSMGMYSGKFIVIEEKKGG